MSDALVTVENTTGVAQRCVFEEKLETLHPMEQRVMGRGLADTFASMNPGRVKLVLGASYPVIPGEDTVWVANMTGNPFAVETVKVKRQLPGKDKPELVEEPNQLRVPRVLKEKIRLSQTWIPSPKTPNEKLTVPGKLQAVVIPPYQRIPLSQTIAERVIQRAATYEAEHQGSLVVCNAPTAHEPNSTWPLDNIRVYASLLDDVGLSDTVVGIKPFKAYGDDKTALEKAKHRLLQCLHFRLCDQNYRAPTEKEFSLRLKELTSKK